MDYYKQAENHPGQINLDTQLGKKIFNLVFENNFENILDIGTWNGLGTTNCILSALEKKNNFTTKLFTVELYEEMYEIASNNLKNFSKLENFIMLNGRIIDYEEIFWFDHKTLNFSEDAHARLWFTEDLKRLFNAKSIKNLLPEKIDLVILDGGEYTTYPEWVYLKNKIKYFILDDTKTLKCSKIREEVLNNKNYSIIEDNLSERNGYLIGKIKWSQ